MAVDYLEWLNDVRNNAYRILLIELDYAGGTIYLGSKPWLSDTNISYSDAITSPPFIEDNLNDFAGVGDLNAINVDKSINWIELIWNGHQGRWYHGDVRWLKEEFRQIAITTTQECKALGGSEYQFNLFDNGQRLKRTFVTMDTQKILSIADAVEWMSEQTGVSIILTNVSAAKLAWMVTFDVNDTTLADEVVRKVATSIGGHLRMDQLGNAEVFVPSDTVELTLTEDQIGYAGLSMIENIQPYRTVTILEDNDVRNSGTTNVDTGEIEQEITIPTYLNNTPNATSLLAEKVDYHANKHTTWEILVLAASNFLQVGDKVTIVHSELKQTGVVQRINRSPLSYATTVEVIV